MKEEKDKLKFIGIKMHQDDIDVLKKEANKKRISLSALIRLKIFANE